MKLPVIFLLICSISSLLHAQKATLEERTYTHVIKEGPSTAPPYIVVTIADLNTGFSREICTDISTLSWCLKKENNQTDDQQISDLLLREVKDRLFSFKNEEVLAHLNFEHYTIKDQNYIAALIRENFLTDSLRKVSKLRKCRQNKLYKYTTVREKILKKMADSIKLIRHADKEESRILSDLRDPYYDEYYNNPTYNPYRTLSTNAKILIGNWNTKIKRFKNNYAKITTELNRRENKFFNSYYNKYGLNFCHAAFKSGIVSYLEDGQPVVRFSEVIK